VRVFFVSQYEPQPVGHGGYHRAYQVLHDLRAAVGSDNVLLHSLDLWWKRPLPPPPETRIGRLGSLARRALDQPRGWWHYYRENPLKLFAATPFSINGYAFPGFLAEYEEAVHATPRPACCVLEHTSFARLAAINARHGVPTVYCPQNIEAFDLQPLDNLPKTGRYSAAVDFINEIDVLGQATERLFISRVETGLVGGLGFPSRHYAYRPVAAIRECYMTIRRRREAMPREPGLFLLIGTAAHVTTGRSFAWFVTRACREGLPPGARIVVVGFNTNDLAPAGTLPANVELRGWVEQAELDDLMVRATAALVPQQLGFGALTRIAELACAGIPALVSPHATMALDLPPGVVALPEDSWEEWRRAMTAMMDQPPVVAEREYTAWEARQPNPLRAVVTRLLGDTE
jgi:hypothetical protein